jgi:hypothetical protein
MVTVSRAVVVGATCLVRAYRFASSVVTPRGYKAGDHPCAHLSSLAQTPVASSPPLLHLKREGDRERDRNRTNLWGSKSVASPSLSNYGRAGLDPFRGRTGAPVGPHEPGIHDGGGAHNLSCARGPRIPCADGGIRGGFHSVL